MENYVHTLQKKKWGIFNHYLAPMFLNPDSDRNGSLGIPSSWDECVKRFDAERLAFSLHKMGAGYYFITVMQCREFMLAPNETFDKIAGTKPGEACATRDLPLDLYNALSRYNIDLCLYFTGDGPSHAPFAKNFGFERGSRQVTEDFVKKWSSVLEEYAVRYGDKVKAWWFDGMYKKAIGYTDELQKYYHDAVHKGNPYAATAFNNGFDARFGKNYINEEFCAGEFNYFGPTPNRAEREATVPHILSPLGYVPGEEWQWWSKGGVRYTKEFAIDYINTIHKLGGFTTIDILVNVDGSFDPEQEAFLRYVGNHL